MRIGTAHVEVMLTQDGPRLIEYNGRWHLTDFRQLCDDCVGYNAIDATVDAYLDPEVRACAEAELNVVTTLSN